MKKKPSMRMIQWLNDELKLWHDEKVITHEQADIISKRYVIPAEKRGAPGKFITVILIIGAFLLGAGILLLIASNWNSIPGWLKIVVIYLLIGGVNYAGYDLQFIRKNNPRLGAALLLLGSILFGGGIWLTAQVFQINAHFTNGLLFWFIGIIPIAWILRSVPILALSSVILTGWALWENIGYENPAWFYPLLLLAGIVPLAYILKSRLALCLALTGLLFWTGFGALGSRLRENLNLVGLLYAYLPIGILMYSTGIVHSFFEQTKKFEAVYKFVSSLLFCIFLYTASFRFSGNAIADTLETALDHGPVMHFSFWIIFGLALAIAVFSLVYIVINGKRITPGIRITIGEAAICIILSFLPFFFSVGYFVVLVNIILFGLSLALIFIGYVKKKKSLVNLGFIFFGLIFITRYIDIGWMYAERALFFIVSGIIIILSGLGLETLRRSLIRRFSKAIEKQD
jgi:uncharacterized membrane protein